MKRGKKKVKETTLLLFIVHPIETVFSLPRAPPSALATVRLSVVFRAGTKAPFRERRKLHCGLGYAVEMHKVMSALNIVKIYAPPTRTRGR